MFSRVVVLCALLVAGPLTAAPADWIAGADISHLPQLEAAGATFKDQGKAQDLLQILKRHGINTIRLKVWNEPGKYPIFPADQSSPVGYHNPDHVLAMAKRAQAAGLGVIIDFHYSDWWADPGKQSMPVAWRDKSPEQVATLLHDFTRQLMVRLQQAGITPRGVQVGNEITNGMMWPLGKAPEWDNLARFIRAGHDAVKSVFPQTPVILHLDAGGDNPRCQRWFDAMLARQVQFDIIGLSYYPVWHGSLQQVGANMNDLATRYGKPVLVVETAYPWTTENGDSQRNIYTDTGPETFPMTPQGQVDFLRALNRTVQSVPNGRGLGVIYWEPDFIPVKDAGWKAGAGDEWDNVTLFDFQGNVLPGLSALGAKE